MDSNQQNPNDQTNDCQGTQLSPDKFKIQIEMPDQETTNINNQVGFRTYSTMRQRKRHRLIVGIVFIVGTLLLILPTTSKASTMGIATRSSFRQSPTQKGMITKPTPPQGGMRRSERTHKSPKSVPKSPMSVEVNSHLAEINLPQTRFDNMLTALGRATETNARRRATQKTRRQLTRMRTTAFNRPAKDPPSLARQEAPR